MSLSDRTKKQLLSVKNKFFTPDFESAYKKLLQIKEVHKRALVSTQINSLMKMEPSLKPSKELYDKFLKEHKEWTKQKNQYYNKKSKEDDVSKKQVNSFVEICKEKAQQVNSNPTKKKLQEYMLCLLFLCIPDEVLGRVDLRKMQLKQSGTNKDQNYITRNYIYIGNYKQSGSYGVHKAIQLKISERVNETLKKLRQKIDGVYIFGGDQALSQPAFSQLVKRTFGATMLQVRKMVKSENARLQLKDYC